MIQKIKGWLSPIVILTRKSVKIFLLRRSRIKYFHDTFDADENGFLYIVTGDGYAQECIFSIRSLKKYDNSKICVYSEEKYRALFEGECDFFCVINTKIKRPKVEYISQSPFKNTIYLDSDTFINYDITELFDLLEKYDFCSAFCNARKRENYSNLIPEYGLIPYSFSEVNSGVMVFNDSDAVKELFMNWKDYYYKFLGKTNGWDQPSLRVSLWNSNVKICHLPPEYNVRPKSVYQKVKNNKHILGNMHMEPRIYHMHYSPEVHNGKFEIDDLNELKEKVEKLAIEITY